MKKITIVGLRQYYVVHHRYCYLNLTFINFFRKQIILISKIWFITFLAYLYLALTSRWISLNMITPVWRLLAINNDVSEWKTNIVFILWSLSLQIWYKTWSGEVSNFLLSSSLCGSWVAWLPVTSGPVTTVTHSSTMYDGVVAKWCCFTGIW